MDTTILTISGLDREYTFIHITDAPGFQVNDYGDFFTVAVDDSNKVISETQLEARVLQNYKN